MNGQLHVKFCQASIFSDILSCPLDEFKKKLIWIPALLLGTLSNNDGSDDKDSDGDGISYDVGGNSKASKVVGFGGDYSDTVMVMMTVMVVVMWMVTAMVVMVRVMTSVGSITGNDSDHGIRGNDHGNGGDHDSDV